MSRIFDREVRSLSRDDVARTRRRIGVVHQDCQFLDHLPLATNVHLPLTVSGRTAASAGSDRPAGLGRAVHIWPMRCRHRCRGANGSARRWRGRSSWAPDVILADEPTGNVDWEMSLRLLTLLVELNKMGKTILVATHDLNLIRQAKTQVPARVLRITNRRIQLAGADL